MGNINIMLQSDSSNPLKAIIDYHNIQVLHFLFFYSFKNLSVVSSILNLLQICPPKRYFDRVVCIKYVGISYFMFCGA